MREVLKPPGVIILPVLPTQRDEKLPLSSGGQAEQLADAVRTLEQLFPNICPKEAYSYLRLCLNLQPVGAALELTVDHFLRNGFPQSKSSNANGASTSNLLVGTGNERDVQVGKDFVELSSSSSDESEHNVEDVHDAQCYYEWCIFRLSMDFPRIALPSLKNALKVFQGNLGPTYKAVYVQNRRASKKKGVDFVELRISADQSSEDVTWLPKGKLKLLKSERLPRVEPGGNCPRFRRDWETLRVEFGNSGESASNHNNIVDEFCKNVAEEPPADVLIECGCCCSENPFEDLVQCADGHLFCTECLRRHLESYIFGGSQTSGLPTCMDTSECDKTFPWSEVQRSLPVDVLSKYEQRQAEDAVSRAKLEGLVYCPFCNFPWEVDPGMKVLYCTNETCRKASCIQCKEPNHQPQRCEDVEKKSETSLRRKVEELMTKALIRECNSCKAELVKIEGCNKITCRCGQNMCYVCRVPITDYSHFCQHAREPGLPCKQCPGCSLWEKENEDEVVKAAKQAAIQQVQTNDPGLLKRDVGPSEENRFSKKPRVLPVPPYAAGNIIRKQM